LIHYAAMKEFVVNSE